MKALVTGANGFLGRHVVAALRRRGHGVRALVRPASRLEGPAWDEIEIVRADLRAPGDLTPAFDGIDVLVHLAAAVTGGEEAQLSAAVVGTEKLLEAMVPSTTRRAVLASSFSVYDWSRIRGTLTEESPIEPAPDLYNRDGYAIAKVWQERVARRIAAEQGWALTVLRPGFIWGPGNEYLACLGQTIGPCHLVFGPGTRPPLTYVENCAELFARAAEDPRAAGETFNVVDGHEVSAWRYLGDHLQRSGASGVRLPIPYGLAAAGVASVQWLSNWLFRGKGKLPSLLVPCRFEARFKPLHYSNRKAREVLGWEPQFGYEESVDLTYGRPRPPAAPSPNGFDASPSEPAAKPTMVSTQ
ncbi:MAG: NAD(P)-dependent oxidoreductase [Isosphaeraceae bacterium]|nr:NAD(P)-dependent oxidoreductase [Isosphaeraceae bacterium]